MDYKQLVKDCVRQKPIAQEELYRHFAPVMLGVCYRYTKSLHDAEDVLQEGFVKVFRNIERFRGDGAFEGWLRRIFVNTAIEHYRKTVQMYPIMDFTPLPSETTDLSALDNLMAEDLMNMLQELSQGYKTVFNLYVIEGYSHKEIADMLSITEGTSKSQLARARYLLQKKLQDIYKHTEENYVWSTWYTYRRFI